MATGKVKRFNTAKGYGFIEQDKGGSDIFMHIYSFEDRSLKKMEIGQRVSYEVTTDKRGKPAAAKVKCLVGNHRGDDRMDNVSCQKLCVGKLGFSLGIASALFTFLLGIGGKLIGYGGPVIVLYASIYPGFSPTFLGSLIGAIWAFIGTFLFILVAGLIYCLSTKVCQYGCYRKRSCGKRKKIDGQEG